MGAMATTDIHTFIRDKEVDALMILDKQLGLYGPEHGWDKISWYSRRVLWSLVQRLAGEVKDKSTPMPKEPQVVSSTVEQLTSD